MEMKEIEEGKLKERNEGKKTERWKEGRRGKER